MAHLTRAMVQSYVMRHDLEFELDSDGDYAKTTSVANSHPVHYFKTFLMLSGKDRDILTILSISDHDLAQHQMGKAAMICNRWNQDRRWPTAYVNTDGSVQDIRLSYNVPLYHDVSQELLDSMLLQGIVSTESFWEWAFNEQGL